MAQCCWFLALLLALGGCTAGPLHAQCRVQWYFGISCDLVREALLEQIQRWRTADGCSQGGQRCLYQLKSVSAHFITAQHVTPGPGQVHVLTFRLLSYHFLSSCQLSAMSISQSWYAVKDHGTNYCNLYNLLEGSGLSEASGYVEVTSDFLCTQRSSANCSVY